MNEDSRECSEMSSTAPGGEQETDLIRIVWDSSSKSVITSAPPSLYVAPLNEVTVTGNQKKVNAGK